MTCVRVMTDSTADIPDELVEELEIGIIYDYINFDTQSLRDKADISRAEFYARLATEREIPTTASPGVGEFESAFRRAGAPDCAIITLHPPVQLSALYNTAVLASKSFPEGRVTVIDSGQISMGLGWLVVAAAKAARANASVDSVIDLVTAMKPRIRLFAALDTFEYLRRSGRVNWAQTIVGTLLRIKPLIEFRKGRPLPLDRVRTRRRAMDRLVELTEAAAPLESLAIVHSNWSDGAEELCRRLNHLRPKDRMFSVDVTPVLGVHVGPNGLGVAAVCADHSPVPGRTEAK